MSKRSDFLYLVQSIVLLAKAYDGVYSLIQSIQTISVAVALPEEAIPVNVAQAASEFVSWSLLQTSPKPDWVVAHEENLARAAIPKDKACVKCGNYTNGTPYCSRSCAMGDGRI